MVFVGEDVEGECVDAEGLDGGRLEALPVAVVLEGGGGGVGTDDVFPTVAFYVERDGSHAQFAVLTLLGGGIACTPQEIGAIGHPGSPEDDEIVVFGCLPEFFLLAVFSDQGHIGEGLPRLAAFGIGKFALDVEQVVVVGVFGTQHFQQVFEFGGAHFFVLGKVVCKEIDGNGGEGIVLDVGACRICHLRRILCVGLFPELVHQLVFLVAVHHIVSQVVGGGFILKVFVGSGKDDLFHSIGEHKDVGGHLIGFPLITEPAFLHGQGVEPCMVAVLIVDVEFPCLHVAERSLHAEGVATRSTGDEQQQQAEAECVLHSLL